jgi:hypothetical protein
VEGEIEYVGEVDERGDENEERGFEPAAVFEHEVSVSVPDYKAVEREPISLYKFNDDR